MKRPTKTRLTKPQKAFDTDVRIETLEALIEAGAERLNVAVGIIDNLVKAVADMQVEQRKAGEFPEMSDMDKVVMEDALIGLWMTEQANDGKTNVDLSIVEHIRTGLRLAIASR